MSQGQTMQQSVKFNRRQLKKRKTIFDRKAVHVSEKTKVLIENKMTPKERLLFTRNIQIGKNKLFKKRLLVFAIFMISILYLLHYINTH